MLVTRTDLRQWSDQKAFQGHLPHLIRLLAHAGLEGIQRIGFPAGDGTAVTGLDGVIVVPNGNAWIPSGRSFWEMGTDQKHKAKATSDYEKRTEDVDKADRLTSTFVFVTPRTWDGNDKQAWLDERLKQSEWADVRAYSCDDLEQWIETCPAVGAWLANLMGKYGPLEPVSEWWDEWASRTVPPFPLQGALGGRGAASEDIVNWLQSPPSVLTVQAETKDEAFAFAVASLLLLSEPMKTEALSRAVVVKDAHALRQIEYGNSLILLLDFDEPAGGRAAQRGHHVLRAEAGRAATGVPGLLTLPPLHRGAMRDALQAAGVGQAEAERICRLGGAGLGSIRRALAHPGMISTPNWATPEHAAKLGRLVLLPEWTGSTGDRAAVERITLSSFNDADDLTTRWASEPDSPLQWVGEVRGWASDEDAWMRLSSYLQPADITRFCDLAVEVLREVHPRFELPAEERYMAAIHGKVLTHSSKIRRAIATTVGRLGAAPASVRADAYPRERAADVVRRVLEAPASWQLWATLDRELPLLAEAAPDAFLGAVDAALAGDLAGILPDEGGPAGGCNHAGLLRALELLAWSSDYITQATLLLGQLVDRDVPDQRYANRPANSLRQIFLSWYPQTSATLAQRFAALDVLTKRLPRVAFGVLKSILPEGMSTATETCKPTWRAWTGGSESRPTHGDIHRVYTAVVPRLLALARADADHWTELIGLFGRMGPTELDSALTGLREHAQEGLGEAETAVRAALRRLLGHHRRFAAAEWRMEDARLEAVEQVYQSLEPTDALDRSSWLFADEAALPNPPPDDWKAESAQLETERDAAARQMLSEYGAKGIVQHCGRFERPEYWGRAAARGSVAFAELAELAGMAVAAGSPKSRALLAGLCQGAFARGGMDAVRELRIEDWPSEVQVLALNHLPFASPTWKFAEALGQPTRNEYWRRCPAHWVPDEDTASALETLLDADRPLAALRLARMHDSALDSGLVENVLRSAAAGDPTKEPADLGSLAFGVNKLLSRLESDGADDELIAELELAWLPVLRHEPGRPRALLLAIAREPKLFVQLLTMAFRAEDEQPKDPSDITEEQSARAARAYGLLHDFHWTPASEGEQDWSGLAPWFAEVRRLADACKMRMVADILVGEALARVPVGADGHWPHEAVREVLESTSDRRHLESGLGTGVFNSRGATFRPLDDGGRQERELAEVYRATAAALTGSWPATAAFLRRLAQDYERDAVGEDTEADLRSRDRR